MLKRKKERKGKGVTLLELLIIVVIVGVLATLGLMNYGGVREKSLTKEALANLQLIAAAERIYRMEYGTYYGPESDIGDINSVLKLSLSGRNWGYSITQAGADTFTSTADRTGGSFDTCVYTIDEATDRPVPVNPANCPK